MARRTNGESSGHTILVVDDQEETLTSLAALLRREGHAVLTADSAESALRVLQRNEVDLLLVDYQMPRATGADLVRAVRDFDPFVQIVLQTGLAPVESPRALMAGLDVHGFHEKADGPEKMLLWVDSALKSGRLIKRLRQRLDGVDRRRRAPSLSKGSGQLRDLILAKLCHEVRNALHVIRGYTDVLREEVGEGAATALLSGLDRASDSALDAVQSYLALAAFDSSEGAVKHEAVEVHTLCDRLGELSQRLIGGHAVRFVVEPLPAPLVVWTDAVKLNAILGQILASEVKLARAGQIHLRVRESAESVDFELTSVPSDVAADELKPGLDEEVLTPGQALGLAMATQLSDMLGASVNRRLGPGGALSTVVSVPRRFPAEPHGTLH